MAFPGVFYWDRVQTGQLIMSAFKCPKVFGWKLLQTLKKCLIIRAPWPEPELGSQKFTHLLRGLGQNVSRPESSCNFRWQQGLRAAQLPPRKIMASTSKLPFGVTHATHLRCEQTSEGAQHPLPRETPIQITTKWSLPRGTWLEVFVLFWKESAYWISRIMTTS